MAYIAWKTGSTGTSSGVTNPFLVKKEQAVIPEPNIPIAVPNPVTKQETTQAEPLGFMVNQRTTMANNVALQEGGENWYGSGLQGWFRKTFASVMNPELYFANPNDDEKKKLLEMQNEYATNAVGSLWEKYLAPLVGISAQELGEAAAAFTGSMVREGNAASKVLPKIAGNIGTMLKTNFTQSLNNYIMPPAQAGEVPFRQLTSAIGAALDNPENASDFYKKYTSLRKGSEAAYSLVIDEARRNEFMRRVNTGEDPDFVAMEMQNWGAELVGGLLFDAFNLLGGSGAGLNVASDAMKGASVGKKIFGGIAKGLDVVNDVTRFTSGGPILDALKGAKGLKEVGVATDVVKAAEDFAPSISKFSSKASDEFFATPEISSAIKGLGDITDTSKSAEVVPEMAQATGKVKDAIEELYQTNKFKVAALKSVPDLVKSAIKNTGYTEAKSLLRDYSVTAPSTASKTKMVMNSINSMAGFILRGASKDEATKIMSAMQTFASKAKDSPEFQEAYEFAIRSPFSNQIFSKAGARFGAVMAELSDNGKIFDILSDPNKTVDELIPILSNKLEAVSKKLFVGIDELRTSYQSVSKSIGELPPGSSFENAVNKAINDGAIDAVNGGRAIDYDKLGFAQRFASAWHTTIPGKTFRALNSIFSNMYMGYTPGFALRNLFNNTVTISADMGVEVGAKVFVTGVQEFFKPGSRQVILKDGISKKLGFLPGSIAADITRRAENKLLGVKGYKNLLVNNQAVEDGCRLEAMSAFIDRELDTFIRGGTWIPKNNKLSSQDLDLFRGLTSKYNGDMAKVKSEFSKIVVEDWRHIEMSPTMKDWMQRSNTYDEFVKIRDTAQAPDEFLQRSADLINGQVDAAKGRLLDEATIEPSLVPKGAEKEVEDINKALQDGLISFDKSKILTELKSVYWQAGDKAKKLKEDYFFDVVSGMDRESVKLLKNEAGIAASKVSEKFQHFNDADIDKVRSAGIALKEKYEAFVKGNLSVFKSNDDAWAELESLYAQIKKQFPEVDWEELKKPLVMSPENIIRNMWSTTLGSVSELWKFAKKVSSEADMEFIKSLSKSTNNPLPNFEEINNLLKQGEQAQSVFLKIRQNEYRVFEELSKMPEDATLDLFGVSGYDKKYILNMVNADRRAAGLPELTPKNISPKTVAESISKRLIEDMPIVPSDDTVNIPKGIVDSFGHTKKEIDVYLRKVSEMWGVTSTHVAPDMEEFISQVGKNFNDMKMIIGKGSEEAANFALHSYDKTNLDLMLQYVMPYSYWYTRSYPKWAQRLAENPEILVKYAKYRRALEQQHAGYPDWYKYQIEISHPFGIQLKNPLFFNLESAINPLNGITGIDFNDKNKRVDWLSSTVDDLQKFGPSLFTPINWAMAAHLAGKGEEDAAKRWLGRLIPQTEILKDTLYGLGIKLPSPIPNNDLDPFAAMFMGGMTPYEERRVVRALANMVENGTVLQEDADKAADDHSGALWDMAVKNAASGRALAMGASTLFGTGFKPRSEEDLAIDRAYGAYYALMSNRDNMSPADFRTAMAKFAESSPFYDVLLIGNKGGEERSTAYAYNVLGRLPPGMSTDVFKALGMNQDIVDKFYNDKGMENMNEADKKAFESAIVNLGALLKMPQYATREQWNQVKSMKDTMDSEGQKIFGENIWDLVYGYYDAKALKTDASYLQKYPQVQEAMDWQTEVISSNPELSAYYGGLQRVEMYYAGKQRELIVKEFGEDIFLIKDTWSNIIDQKEKTAYYKAHPELNAYSARNKELEAQINAAILRISAQLPDIKRPSLRTGEPGYQTSGTQQMLQGVVNPPQIDYMQELPVPLQNVIAEYFATNEPLSSNARNLLDSYAKYEFGMYDADELLAYIYRFQSQVGNTP